MEGPDADAGVDQQAELGDGEAGSGTHPGDEAEQGEVADAEQDASAELRGRGPQAQPDRLAGREGQGQGGAEDSDGEREVAYLRGYCGPLCWNEVTSPQKPCRARP